MLYERHGQYYSIGQLCRAHQISRQAYYHYQRRQEREILSDDMVVSLIQKIRWRMPMVGGRKLHYMLKDDLARIGHGVGRDKFFTILRRNMLLVKRQRRYARTTYSYHRFRVHKNLIKEMRVERPNQVLVADITYLSLIERFCYLALLTDMYSRKIVGWNVSDSLDLRGCIAT